MSLLLCRQESVTHPYDVEFLGIRIYSSPELCYVIYHNPLLVMDGFIHDSLLTFLRDELNLGFLALKLDRWIKSGENLDEMLIMILQECDYYQGAEITRYRQQITGLRKLHPAEFGKKKADEFARLRQYGKALLGYRELLELPEDQVVTEVFLGNIWNNIGVCHGRMFQLERAFSAFEKAYTMTQEDAILKSLYYLTQIDPRLTLGDRFETLLTPELRAAGEEILGSSKTRAEASGYVQDIERLFSKDQVKRQAGTASLLDTWKQEYRNMV